MNGATFTFRSSADAPNVKREAEIDRTVSGGTITVRSAPDPIADRKVEIIQLFMNGAERLAANVTPAGERGA